MQTITAHELQKSFGTFTDLVLSGEAVRVTRYGRPAYLILPENDRTADDQHYAAAGRLSTLLKTARSNTAAKALALDDVSALINECFA